MSTLTAKTITSRVGYMITEVLSREDGFAVVKTEENDEVNNLAEGSEKIRVGDYLVVVGADNVHFTADEVAVSWTVT